MLHNTHLEFPRSINPDLTRVVILKGSKYNLLPAQLASSTNHGPHFRFLRKIIYEDNYVFDCPLLQEHIAKGGMGEV